MTKALTSGLPKRPPLSILMYPCTVVLPSTSTVSMLVPGLDHCVHGNARKAASNTSHFLQLPSSFCCGARLGLGDATDVAFTGSFPEDLVVGRSPSFGDV